MLVYYRLPPPAELSLIDESPMHPLPVVKATLAAPIASAWQSVPAALEVVTAGPSEVPTRPGHPAAKHQAHQVLVFSVICR